MSITRFEKIILKFPHVFIESHEFIFFFYLAFFSSSISWGQKFDQSNKVFKAFANHKMEKLEQAYQKHMQQSESLRSDDFNARLVKIDEGEEADFEQMVLFVGKTRVLLERHHAPSVYVNYFQSPNQTNLHLMINNIQVQFNIQDY